MGAPTCFDPQVFTPGGDPQVKNVGNIPVARDLASTMAAVNSMRDLLIRMFNDLNRPSGGGSRGKAGPKKPPKRGDGRYVEVHRTLKTRRVFNPKDHEQHVDVQEITSLVMRDKLTGEQWVWTR